MLTGAHGGTPLQLYGGMQKYRVLYVFIFPMITIMWMQAGAHGGTPLQFEKAACREYMSFMSLCPTNYVFMSNKICLSV